MQKNGSDAYLWQPKGGFKDDEQSKLNSGKLTMIEVMANHEVIIAVEPIVWNRLRNSATAWTSVCMYGTQSNIGYGCAQMKAQGLLTGGAADYGGYDVAVFGEVGRKAMITTKEVQFNSFTVAVPVNNVKYVTNTMVVNKEVGWSLHLYTLKPKDEEDPEKPKTSTFDEPDHPITGDPPHVQPHKAQDPYEPDDPNFDR